FRYLIGSRQQLAPVWRAWYAAPQIPGDPESAHTAIVWLVDAQGRLAAKVAAGSPFDTSGLADGVGPLLPGGRARSASGSNIVISPFPLYCRRRSSRCLSCCSPA